MSQRGRMVGCGWVRGGRGYLGWVAVICEEVCGL